MTFKRKFADRYNDVIATALIILSILLVAASTVMLNRYSKNLKDQAEVRVENYTYETGKRLVDGMGYFLDLTQSLADKVAKCTTEEEVLTLFKDIKSNKLYGAIQSIRFFDGDSEYVEDGNPYEFNESKKILSLKGTDKVVCTGIIQNNNMENEGRSVGFFAPVNGSDLLDSIVVIYPLGSVNKIFDSSNISIIEDAEVLWFCDSEGKVLKTLQNNNPDFNESDSILNYIRSQSNDKETVDEIERCMKKQGTSAFSIYVNGIRKIVSVSGSGENGAGFSVIGMYNATDIYESDFKIINTILSIIIIVFSIIIVAAIYFSVYRRITTKKIYEASEINPVLGCYTPAGFRHACENILRRHKVTKFAIVVVEINFLNYISEHFGLNVSDDFLKYMKYVCNNTITIDEALGHSPGNRFVMLMHYRDKTTLINRLENLDYSAVSYPEFKNKNYALKLNFGICEIDRTKDDDIQKIINKAVIAMDSAVPEGENQKMRFYSEEVHNSYIQYADIESKSDYALQNNEFIVFYQPKINIKENRIDSAEALVRWYDYETQTYRSPATFIPLFESNGFIDKLDRYVYKTVCHYISDCVKEGLRVYPVSVNISRVTVSKPHFLDYYVDIKKECKIPDNFITLEITESFAYENYDYLQEVVNDMHKNGFLCSADDFGTGSSSYNFLKQLNINELKLDRFFINQGVSKERDDIILKDAINMGKSLGMKVVQEGVETEDDVIRLKNFGCEIIQGYYFSKPLSPEDYKKFTLKEVHRNEN